jgi:hypothetical protein
MATREATIPKRVAAGAAALDAEWDGWEAEIDLTLLDMSSGNPRAWGQCILTQLWGNYQAGRFELGIDALEAEELGFEAMEVPLNSEYEALDAAWTELIENRRDGQ